MAIKEGDFVEINYTGKINDSSKAVFDTTDIAVAKQEEIYSPKTKYGPAVIVVGEGQVLPGIDKQIVGKEIGKYTFDIPDVDAFGKKDAKLMKLLSNKIFVKEGIRPQPGLQVNIDDQMGFIRSVSGGRVIVDFNHPLASKDLIYDVEVIRIITDKQEQAQAFFDTMGLPIEKVTASDKEIVVTTKKLLPKEFNKALAEDLKRLIKVENVSFLTTEGEKKEAAKTEQKTEVQETKKE